MCHMRHARSLKMYKKYDPRIDAPDEPQWHKNLQRAWASNRERGEERRAVIRQEESQELLEEAGTAREVLDNPNAWFDYCQEHHICRKPGRPKLPDHLKKNPTKIKRSDQMRKLLHEHGIEISDKNSIEGFDGFEFMKNGRIKFLGDEDAGIEPYSLSAHQFLQDYL